MKACNFECLLQFVNKELDRYRDIEVCKHLSRCSICRDTVYQLSRDLAEASRSGCTHMIANNLIRLETNGNSLLHLRISIS